MNSAILMALTVLVFALGFRFYSKFLAAKIAKLNDGNPTPAVKLNDGKDYIPMNKWVVLFYHYATIAGAGVLLGPTLGAQYGWLPCIIWILIATCLAGGVHDFMVMFLSVRNDGKSIGEIARKELGRLSWVTITLATFFMAIVAISGMGMGLINALEHNPWATFTVMMTIPISIFIHVYTRWIGRMKTLEASAIGLAILMALFFAAGMFKHTWLLNLFDLNRETLIVLIALYSSIASILPVQILLTPRDHLSGLIKVAFVALLVVAIFFAHPTLEMPPVTEYNFKGGPVISGALWPFLFITITCGAISGWHSLCCSGVTPRLLSKETDIRTIAYGGWLLESAIAVVALCLACILAPGDYFAVNTSPKVYATLGMEPVELKRISALIDMELQGRTGGVTSLSVSIAKLLSGLFGPDATITYWYQIAIVYIGIFVMPIMDHGTRMGRYFMQDALGIKHTKTYKWWLSTIVLTIIMAFTWTYLLYTGTISVIWPMFGMCNQLMACIGLLVATSYVLKHHNPIYGLIVFWPVLVFAFASIHGGVLKVAYELLPMGTTVAYVQSSVFIIFIVLFTVTLVDSLRNYINAIKAFKKPSQK
ncbi:carbon starvation protein A [Candidatus Bathyarchaeota archaeon]|nr:carbon starvation protein A [Candidatus Bathyarchaeota archaeon]MBS7613494.1 carbon starvation protein A [Candidatus Bathyarchaeota archaeon]MBS7618736.1 carbon starvation protein A [Candidatus Bathyarchaeota archaeon]